MNFLFLLAAIAHASIPVKVLPEKSSVNFLAVGKPSMLKIHGEAKGTLGNFSLEKKILTGAVELDLNNLATGISLRDQHMKEKYLQVAQFPKAVLEMLHAEIDSEDSLTNAGEKKFDGRMTLHGKSQAISGTFTLKDGQVLANFPLKLSDFAVEIPSYLGVTVAETVDVKAQIVLQK